MGVDERADRLAAIACEAASRVRDEDPVAFHRWLRTVMDGEDWCALAVVQSAAIPIDQPWSSLIAWARFRAYEDGRLVDTPEAIAKRRRDLLDALDTQVGSNQHRQRGAS